MGRMQQILLYVWLLFLMAQRVAVALVSDWVVYLVNGTFASAFPPEFSISSWILGHWVSPRGCCCSIAKLFPTLCDPMDCGTLGSSVLHHSPGVCSNSCTLSQWWYLSISSSAALFSFCLQSFLTSGSLSSELAFHIRWPKYWSFSLSISPSNEYSELISFRMDWLVLLAVQGTLQSLLQYDHKYIVSTITCKSETLIKR